MHQVRSFAVANEIVRASFFERDPLSCARELIGTELIWGDCSGIVIEVEAYAAINDEAAHTFTRPSARSFIERNTAGAAYVYFNYGMHWMLKVKSRILLSLPADLVRLPMILQSPCFVNILVAS